MLLAQSFASQHPNLNHCLDLQDTVHFCIMPALLGAMQGWSVSARVLRCMVAQVEEVALQSCRFMRWDGAKVYYPTYVLARTPFINMSRSGFKWESFIVSPFSICLAVTGIVKLFEEFCKDYSFYSTRLIQLINVMSSSSLIGPGAISQACMCKGDPSFHLAMSLV